MFVYYDTHLEQPFGTVEPQLICLVGAFDGFAVDAYHGCEALGATIGTSAVAKRVRIHIGPIHRGPTETIIPLVWEATGAPQLFPKMEADLMLTSAGPDRVKVALRGLYDPPFGSVGRAIDRVLLHRFAEASVKAFVDRIVGALRQGAGVRVP